MKQVELVRQRLVTGFGSELRKVRVWLSMVEGNADAVDRLRDSEGDELLAGLVERTMVHLGHETEGPKAGDHRANRTQARKRSGGQM